MKTKIWIIIFAAITAAGCLFYVFMPSHSGNAAEIYQDGELLYTIDLSAVEESYELTLTRNGSANTVLVEKDSIRVISADCPDKVCVEHGELKSSTSPIVCLPNRVVIKLAEDTGEVDAIAGAAS